MKVIAIATSDSRAYYSILSRLKRTHIHFVSLVPRDVSTKSNRLVITTKREAELFRGLVFAIEDLDQDPLVMEGQIISKILKERERVITVGIDPGSRIGVAIFYGDNRLGSLTLNSPEALQEELLHLSESIPHNRMVIKIGHGAPGLSRTIAHEFSLKLPTASIEIVDENGTSARGWKDGDLRRDQGAAARIALRKGIAINRVAS